MPGGWGHSSQSESRQLLARVMVTVLVVNAAASLLGQTYADLIRPTGSRAWTIPLVADAAAVAAGIAVLLLLTRPPFQRLVGAPLRPRHALAVAAVFFLASGLESLIVPSSGFAHRSRLVTLAIDLPSAVIWMLAIAPLAWHRAEEGLLPALRWLDERRRPFPDERVALVRLPAAAALFALPYWLLLAAANMVVDFWAPHDVGLSIATFFGILMTWLATAALIYLIAERRLRPWFADAFRGAPLPRLATAGIRARLLVAWGLGSGIPLLFVVLTPGALDRDKLLNDPHVVGPVFALLGAVGLIAGFLTMRAAARSLAEPMEEVRSGLGRVRAGDLSVELPIDDAGEVGTVKVGFNEMVAGLRERAVLQDLFGRHVGADVARRAIEEGTALGGEQREATVFFVDLVGSTAIAETYSASEVVDLLNRFFAAVVAAVGAEGGWVNKFEGDGALCVFGTPAEQPDHAARALRAARALSEALKPIADAGIGIAGGDVVAGNVGAEERYEYTVVGRPVNTAARLADEAKRRPARVLAAEAAITAATTEATNWAAVGKVSLRGVQLPVLAFEPLRVAVS
ncbi:MAG: adenylate/guanylate cyclase domain-containing protein [Acidimicrobiia bacterium]|nr:adenylate/guanylate cyclase domain-containing protein [Acidimicrobiia bacterium]